MLYKDSLNEKSNKDQYQMQLINDQQDLDIINYNFPTFWKGKEVKGEGLSISTAIKSFRNDLEKLSKGIPNSMENILKDPPIVQSLKNIYHIMISTEKKFGTDKNLGDFPYMELCYIISNVDDKNLGDYIESSKIYAMNCLEMAIKIDSDSINLKITEDAICSLEQFMLSTNNKLSQSAISLIGCLNRFSPEFCERFCLAGLASALLPHLQNLYSTIIQTMIYCPAEFSLKFLFLLFISVLNTEDENILINFFDGISIFSRRFEFESIPEQLTDSEILPEQVLECRKIISELIENNISKLTNIRLILSIVEFCTLLPSEYPLNIHQNLFNCLTDQSLINQYPILAEKISIVAINFYNQWKDYFNSDFLSILYDFIIKDLIDFKTSFSYVKLMVKYYQIQTNDCDIDMVKLCARFIGCSDSSFLFLCIGLITEIIEKFSVSGQIDKAIQCYQVLNDFREDLESKIEDPDLEPKEKRIIEITLDTISGLIEIMQNLLNN